MLPSIVLALAAKPTVGDEIARRLDQEVDRLRNPEYIAT